MQMSIILSDREWAEFYIGGNEGIFNISSTSSGIDKNKLTKSDYCYMPYITRTDIGNGINQFVSDNQNTKYCMDEENVITIGLDTQTVFYQTHKFFTGQNIQVLRHKELNKHNALFLIPIIKVQMEKFNWGGNGATLGRLSRTKLMLPIDHNNNPDWDFMEQYVKAVVEKKLDAYKRYAIIALSELKYKEVSALEDMVWEEFVIEDIANIKSGKRLTKSDMIKGLTPFIGATDSNNGITEFTSNTNESEDSNILGVNYNGSVVENFYHPYKAIFSDDVKRISFKNIQGNKHLYLFLKSSILKQKSKYQYAYKFNEFRLKRQKILLPIDKKGEPNYPFMEEYMKILEYKKINLYLDFLENRNR